MKDLQKAWLREELKTLEKRLYFADIIQSGWIVSKSIKVRSKIAWMIIFRHKEFLKLIEKYVEHRKKDNNTIRIK